MNLRHTLLSLFAAACLLLSCNKDYDTGVNDTTHPYYRTLRAAMMTVAPVPAVVTFNAADGAVFFGRSGTKFVFPSYAFVGASEERTEGTVVVSVTEYLNKTDMLFADIQQVAEQPVISAGALLVQASQAEQQLHFNPHAAIECYIPVSGTPAIGLGVFSGAWNIDSSVNFKKSSANPDTVLLMQNPVTRKDTNYLRISDEKFLNGKAPFINAGRYMNDSGSVKVSVVVSVPVGGNKGEFKVYALYQNITSVSRLCSCDHDLRWDDIVLSYRPVSFVALGLVNGRFYGGVSSVTPVNGGVYPVHLRETTPAEFRALVATLP